MNGNQYVNEALAKLELGSRIKCYTTDPDISIAFIFRCDMQTASNIIDRISKRLFPDSSGSLKTDVVITLKTAAMTCPRLIAQCILEELEPATAAKYPLVEADIK